MTYTWYKREELVGSITSTTKDTIIVVNDKNDKY